ncbi:MAG: Ig-like domain-containing protein [Pseudomonadota bacterium]
MDMQVAAVLVYDRALSSNEQDRVQAYLRNKYFGGGPGPGPGPQAPQANDDSATVADGHSVVIDVLANDVDDGTLYPDTVLPTHPANGTLSVNPADGAVTYTHDGSGAGSDSFTYTVEDHLMLTSNAATVTVTITPAGGVPAPPAAGLVVHLEADTGVTTSSGSTVTLWSDQSGRGNDLVASGNPRLVAAAPSGAQAIDFDGNGDKLERLSGLYGLPAGDADRTVLLVANYRSKGFGGFAYGKNSCNQAFGTVVNRRKGRLTVQGWCNDFDSGDSGTGQGWLLQSVIHAGGELTHYRDGVLIDTRTHTFDTVLSNMVAGAELDSAPFLDMQIAAILVYDRALSAAEHQQAVDYLRAKYLGN